MKLHSPLSVGGGSSFAVGAAASVSLSAAAADVPSRLVSGGGNPLSSRRAAAPPSYKLDCADAIASRPSPSSTVNSPCASSFRAPLNLGAAATAADTAAASASYPSAAASASTAAASSSHPPVAAAACYSATTDALLYGCAGTAAYSAACGTCVSESAVPAATHPFTAPAVAVIGDTLGLQRLSERSTTAAMPTSAGGLPMVNSWTHRRTHNVAAATAGPPSPAAFPVAASSCNPPSQVLEGCGPRPLVPSSSSSSAESTTATTRATFRQLVVQVEHQLVALSDLACEVKRVLRHRSSILADAAVGGPSGIATVPNAGGASASSPSSSLPSSVSAVSIGELYATFQVLQNDVHLSLTRADRVLSQLRRQRSLAEVADVASSADGPAVASSAVGSISTGSPAARRRGCCAAAQLEHFSETLETLQTEAADSLEALAELFDRTRLQEHAVAVGGGHLTTDSLCNSSSGGKYDSDSTCSTGFRRTRGADEESAEAFVTVPCDADEAEKDQKKKVQHEQGSEGKRPLTRHSGSGAKKSRKGRDVSRNKSRKNGKREELEVADATEEAAFVVREGAALQESNLLLASVLHVGGSALEALRAQRQVLRTAQTKLQHMQNSQLLDVRKLLDAIAWRRRKNKFVLVGVLAACILFSFLWVARANIGTAAATPLVFFPCSNNPISNLTRFSLSTATVRPRLHARDRLSAVTSAGAAGFSLSLTTDVASGTTFPSQ